MIERTYKWDVFLSHASEDKEDCVRPLANKLRENNIKVWYDEFEIDWGDSIRESIDNGLKESRFAIVVLSKDFFKKNWTNNELNGYFSFESKDAKRILPIWYNVNIEDVKNYSPILADRVSANFADGIDKIVDKIAKRLNANFNESEIEVLSKKDLFAEKITWNSLSKYTIFKFGQLGVDEYWQAAFLDDIQDNKSIKTIKDIDNIVEKTHIAVSAYIIEKPTFFKTGTDFITKSIGFMNEEFRRNHNFGIQTLQAFEKYKSLIKE